MLGTRLTIKHLQMIHAVESAGTLTKAAELLNISQPALSSRLQDAEEVLSTQLFLRRGRRLTLSPAGTLLLASARRILTELVRVERELMNLPSRAGQVLRIGMPQYASYSWLPAAVREFETLFPTVELEVVSEAAVHPRHALSRDDVDIALVSSPTQRIQLDGSRYRSKLLIRDEFVALLPANHPKADKPYLVADDFIDETYITNSAVPERNREYELFFQPESVVPERVVQMGFTGPILELVAAGIGTTIITKWILESNDRFDGVVSRPLTKSGLFVNWFALYSRQPELGPQAEALCRVIANSGAA
ncbi:MAG: LysR family transcriptional regulator [Pseudomonadota bacterium]